MLKIIFFIFLFYIFNCRILTEENTKTNKIDQKKNLILVAITNYKWNNLVIFLNHIKNQISKIQILSYLVIIKTKKP